MISIPSQSVFALFILNGEAVNINFIVFYFGLMRHRNSNPRSTAIDANHYTTDVVLSDSVFALTH